MFEIERVLPSWHSATVKRLDIDSSRKRRIYPRREQLARVAWMLASPAFRCSPRPWFGYRRLLLRVFGARVAKGAHIYNTAQIELPWNLEIGSDAAIGERAIIYNLGRVVVGDRATISQGAHICAGTHDDRKPDMPLLRTPIRIGEDAWICADAFIGPGVEVGSGAVVGARSVTTKNVPEWTVVAGNPSRKIRRRVVGS